jgi:MarR family
VTRRTACSRLVHYETGRGGTAKPVHRRADAWPRRVSDRSATPLTKQGATRIIEALLERGYIAREPDPRDARRKRLQVTPLGAEVMREGEALFDDLRRRWERNLGKPELARLEEQLARIVGDAPIRLEAPGWIARE